MRKLTLANALTCFRLIGALVLAFLAPLSIPFYILYALCGLSDAIDGTVARWTKSASPFGAKLDSAADLALYAVMLLRFLPLLLTVLPVWIWVWVAAVLFLRAIDYSFTAWKYHTFAALHSIWNKLTGLFLFLAPFLYSTCVFLPYTAILCALATIAVFHELVSHILGAEQR